jgi:hypothetical protein
VTCQIRTPPEPGRLVMERPGEINASRQLLLV